MKKTLLTCTALVMTGISWPAVAQETDESTSAGQGTQLLDNIVVQAQRRQQDILDVPVAVTAFDAEALDAAGVVDILDLNLASPSFFANTLSDPIGNSPVRIRGIGTGGGNPGFEGAVGMYVDDVYRSRSGAALTTFFDMGGVEVLRGPQGTLFGKNTTAGAIVQRTAAPVLGEFDASLKASAGNYSAYGFEGMVNLPLGENFALRLAGIYDETDGFFSNPVDGRDTAWVKNTGLRASFAFDANEWLSGRIIADWSEWDSPANYGRSTRIDNRDTNGLNNTLWAASALDTASGGAGYWYWAPDLVNPGPADPFSYDLANNQNGDSVLSQSGITAHLNFDLFDNVRLRSITGYRNLDNDNLGGDWDFGPIDFGGGLDQIFDFETFSQEFLLDGVFDFSGGSSLDYVVGVNYFQEDIEYSRRARVGQQFGPVFSTLLTGGVTPAATIGAPGINFQDSDFTQDETSWGVFAHGTYNFNEQFAAIVGVRWNSIEKDATHENNAAATREDYHDLITSSAQGFFLLNGSGLSSPDFQAETEDEEVTYDFTLQYRPNVDMQLYAKYARGFKAGGINLQNDAAGGQPAVAGTNIISGRPFLDDTPEIVTFDPEFVDAYEIGFRWEYLGAGRLGVTLFRSEFEDLQVSTFNGQVFEVINAGSSTTEGIEVENFYVFNENFSTNLAVTLMEASYGSDVVNLPADRDRGLSPELSVVVGGQAKPGPWLTPGVRRYGGKSNVGITSVSRRYYVGAGSAERLERAARLRALGSVSGRLMVGLRGGADVHIKPCHRRTGQFWRSSGITLPDFNGLPRRTLPAARAWPWTGAIAQHLRGCALW